MTMSVIAPGHAETTTTERGRHRDRRPRRGAASADPASTRSHRRARPAGHHLHPQTGDLLPQAVGSQRADAGPGLAPLLRGPRRVRPPHGERQRLHPGGGARDPAQHLRVPHAVAGLERRRLQLPRRQVRPDLGGPRRRGRPPRGRRPHARLQRLVLRHVGDRQLRDRGAERRDAAGLRQPLRLEALAARRRRLVGPAVGRYPQLQGDQRPPRRRFQPPAPAATSTPSSPSSGGTPPRRSADGQVASSSQTSPAPPIPTWWCGGRATGRPSSSRPEACSA